MLGWLGPKIRTHPTAWGMGLTEGQAGLGGDQGGVGRSGLKQQKASSTASPSETAEGANVRALAERILLILGASE